MYIFFLVVSDIQYLFYKFSIEPFVFSVKCLLIYFLNHFSFGILVLFLSIWENSLFRKLSFSLSYILESFPYQFIIEFVLFVYDTFGKQKMIILRSQI